MGMPRSADWKTALRVSGGATGGVEREMFGKRAEVLRIETTRVSWFKLGNFTGSIELDRTFGDDWWSGCR